MKILILPNITRKINSKVTAARPRMIFDLISQLKKKNHDITILGTRDSKIKNVKIIPIIEKGFFELAKDYENPFYAQTAYLTKLAKKAEELSKNFDIIHNHGQPEFINLLIEKNLSCPMVTTIHAQMTPEMDEALSLFPESNLICISKASKKLAQKAEIKKVIHNGIDTDIYKYREKKEDYLLWIGRISKAKDEKGNFLDPKGVRWAIKLAQETESNLKISGNVEDKEFFEKDIKPHLNDKIEFVGEISFEQPLTKEEVASLMQKAKAFLMTINWKEPFGLVMAEAQSCGTPVIGFNRGSVPELVKDGETGFVVDPKKGLEGLKEAYSKLEQIKSIDCRNNVEENFTLEKMAEKYEKIYKEII